MLYLKEDNPMEVLNLTIELNQSDCPVERFEEVSKSEDVYIRQCAAAVPNCPSNILVHLSTDKEMSIREAVASNPNTPTNILEKLQEEDNEEIKRSVEINLWNRRQEGCDRKDSDGEEENQEG